MSGSGGFAVSRSHSGDRFYNAPIRRHPHHQLQRQHQQQQQQHQQQHQQQQQQQLKRMPVVAVAEADNRTDSDDSAAALSKPASVSSSSSPPRPPPMNVTNLDSLLDSVTPVVPAQKSSEMSGRGRGSQEAEGQPFYCLGDLWETFREWSVYGAGVRLLLYGRDPIMQYYVPFLSGIQLYIDPHKEGHSREKTSARWPGEENDAESSRETSSSASSDCEADRRANSVLDGSSAPHSLMNSNHQRLNRLSLRDRVLMNSPIDEAEISNSAGTLVFEYMEQEQPHFRRPLADKVSILASQFPVLKMCRSCDLSPSSWICVAWYPIYRIPVGPTLKDLEASFLTFHSLSTRPRNNGQAQLQSMSGRGVHGDLSSRIRLPVFGLASYKLKGSIITPCGPQECEQENALLQAAGKWLESLRAFLPDYQFFLNHYSHRR